MDPIIPIVRYLRGIKYETLPGEVIELIKQDFLDYCGNTFAGSSDPVIGKAVSLYSEWGGKPEASVFLHGRKLPAVHAALLNSAMGFAMDFDDTHMRGGHVGITVFPAALAIAEMNGGVSGKDFLAAIAGGMEFFCRLGVYNRRRVDRHIFGGWCYQALHASFSSAATAGMLLGLDEESFLNAMALAYHQAAGTGLSALEPADTKTLGPGFGVRAGLTSVFMAQRGITGSRSILGGEYGLGQMYHRGCDEEGIAAGLGERFEMLDMGFKPYASCRLGHRTLDALSRLMREKNIMAEDVESVHIMGSERVVEQLYTPEEVTKSPRNRITAVFSLPWVVACMLTRGKVGISELSEEALADKGILDLAQRVFAQSDPNVDPADHAAALPVTVKTRRGVFETTVNPIAPGDVGNRMTQGQLEEKYHENAQYSVAPLDKSRRDAVVHIAKHLEDVKDLREIIPLLA